MGIRGASGGRERERENGGAELMPAIQPKHHWAITDAISDTHPEWPPCLTSECVIVLEITMERDVHTGQAGQNGTR